MADGFADKVAVVSGGARGIGAAVISAFTAEGGRAVSLDLGDPETPLPSTRYVRADVTDRAQLESAFKGIEDAEGRVDVLVNNAGYQRIGKVEEYEPQAWIDVIDVHLFGMFHCTALSVPFMKRQGGGAIVSVASAAAIVGLPGRGPYSAAKGAITALTRELAVELAPWHVRVNAVAPGPALTPLVQQGVDDGSIATEFLSEIPMRRMARPDEVASTIVFLAGDGASYVTGETLVVDGGWTIQGMRNHPPGWAEDR